MDEYELKETAARVVKSATKSFHMSPPQSGFSDVDTGNFFKKLTEIFENRNRLLIFVTDDLPSITSTMISTPIARKSQMSEHVERLTQENKKQKQEVCNNIFILMSFSSSAGHFIHASFCTCIL